MTRIGTIHFTYLPYGVKTKEMDVSITTNYTHLEKKAGRSAALQIIQRCGHGCSETSSSCCHNINYINTSTIFEVSNVFTLQLRLSVVAQSVLCSPLVRSHFSFREGSVSVNKQTNKQTNKHTHKQTKKRQQLPKENSMAIFIH